MNNKGFLLLGLAGAIALFLFFSPEELMQYSMKASVEGVEVSEPEVDLEAEPEDSEAPVQPKSEAYFKSYYSSEMFYNRAYASIENFDELDEDTRAGILPHHLIFSKYVAEYFERLAGTRDVDTFFVIGPNHFSRGRESVAISKYGYTTPFGEIEPNSDVIEELMEEDYIGWDKAAFDQEHSISSLAGFIKKSFPDARIVPIVLKGRVTDATLDKLYADLEDLAGPDDFVLASIDFSHYMWQNVADFHDELSETVIKTFDYDSLDELEIDSRPTLYTVMKYAESVGAMDVEVLRHTNSAEKLNGKDFVEETTSHFYITFEEGEVTASRNITILALGDMMLGRYVRVLTDRAGDLEYPFELIRGGEDRFFEGSDVVFGNLEGPIEGKGVTGGTSLVFGFNEDTAPLLARMGFTVLSIANNHILNQGLDGYESTVRLLGENGVGACGQPSGAGEVGVVYKKFGDKSVAFVCLENASTRIDVDEAVALIEKVDATVDFTIVSIHWGLEYVHTPAAYYQVNPAHKFVEAGADFIIGHHPHVVQSFEIYEGVPIFYSLGNFVFDQYWSYDTEEMMGIGIVLGDDFVRTYLFPMHSEASQPYLMGYDDKMKFYDRFVSWGGYDWRTEEQIRSGMVEIWR